jgi:hypothetical protein
MRTVGELMEILKNFDPGMPVVYRKAERDGGYIDYEMHSPGDNYCPGGAVVFSSFQPFDYSDAQKVGSP